METRPTVALIDLGALKFNYARVREALAADIAVMAIVKANAYGHGDIEAGRALESVGCAMFGVAVVEEGIRLRQAGIKSDIVILGGIYRGQIQEVFDYSLTPVVFDIGMATALDGYAKGRGERKKVHLKIDTGMGRLGILPGEMSGFLDGYVGLTNLDTQAILSHFAQAESEDGSFTDTQLKLFIGSTDRMKRAGITPEFMDMANSAAAIGNAPARFNLVRPGIMLYGAYPAPRFRKIVDLKPVMSIKTRILHLKTVSAGTPISYGGRFVAKRESLIATLPIGYADGLPRRLSNVGEALIRGHRAPMIGAVCMDITMCDVTDIPGAQHGDEAVILGAQGTERITVEEIAEKAGTISYEIFCNISSRVPRVYAG
ncbi:MAG: alanine racemase [Deltaproteobacteria bacterium]|nr:alanine racemase [Deltaproteobacteria bacterium]